MAFVLLHGNKGVTMSANRAKELEAVIKGTVNGSERQKAFAKTVKKIYYAKDGRPQEISKQVREVYPEPYRRDLE